MPRFRAWCFTINNPTENDESLVRNLANKNISYLIVGREIGDEGTKHFQGYVYFRNPRAMKGVSKLLPRAHLKVANGSGIDNKIYCSKEGNILLEIGEPPQQGARTDLKEILLDVKKNKMTVAQICEKYPEIVLRYSRGIEKIVLSNYLPRDKNKPPYILWVWGPTGVGKTRMAFEKYPNEDSIYIKDGTHWWDGYHQQKCILIDDFDGRWPFRDLLRLLDRYPYQGQYKGGYVHIDSECIIITCDRPPEAVYNVYGETAQLLRRINQVIHLGNDGPDACS